MKKITLLSILSILILTHAHVASAHTSNQTQSRVHVPGNILSGRATVTSVTPSTITLATTVGTTTQTYTLAVPQTQTRTFFASAPASRTHVRELSTVHEPSLTAGDTVEFFAIGKQGSFRLITIDRIRK